MGLQSKYFKGNLVFFDPASKQRWLDAIGPGVVKELEHFNATPFASADNMAGWTTTLVEGGAGESTIALEAGSDGGVLLITTDAAENDGANIQRQGEAYLLSGAKPLYFGCRVRISDATQSDLLVGLCITDTDLLGGMTDGVYFRKVDGAAALSFVLEKDSAETTGTVMSMVADTWYVLEFTFDGTYIDAYVDGVKQTRLAVTNLPNDEYLTPSIHFLTGEAVAKTCRVDWLRVIQLLG